MKSFISRNWTLGRAWGNLTDTEQQLYLAEVLGAVRKYGNAIVWIPTVVYTIISVLGIPGNILTCLTIAKIPYMRTAPNFFIFNLALSDLLSLILGNHQSYSHILCQMFLQLFIVCNFCY